MSNSDAKSRSVSPKKKPYDRNIESTGSMNQGSDTIHNDYSVQFTKLKTKGAENK